MNSTVVDNPVINFFIQYSSVFYLYFMFCVIYVIFGLIIFRKKIFCCTEREIEPEKAEVVDQGVQCDETKNEEWKESKMCCACSDLISCLMECKICFGPIWMNSVHGCSQCGNIWCTPCRYSIAKCPFCRYELMDTTIIPMNKILNEIRFPCINSKHGCGVILKGELRRKHEKMCSFAKFLCPSDFQCGKLLKVNELGPHLEKMHTTLYSTKNHYELIITDQELESMTCHLDRCCVKSVLFADEDTYFLFKVHFHHRNFYITLHVKKFQYEFGCPSFPKKKYFVSASISGLGLGVSNFLTITNDIAEMEVLNMENYKQKSPRAKTFLVNFKMETSDEMRTNDDCSISSYQLF